MLKRRRIRLTVAAACLLSGGPVWGEIPGRTQSPCESAGASAEKANGLPEGLLLAIGRVESGRWDAIRGRAIPWPWTINAGGKGQWFETKEAATRTVDALRTAGTRSIDAGCFQINLLHHPSAFATLDDAFDPVANATYAARFLTSLFVRTGSWEGAVEAYHSADPARGLAYRDQVFVTWFTPGSAPPSVHTGMPPGLATVSAPAVPRDPIPSIIAGVRIWTPLPAGASSGIVPMPPPARPVTTSGASPTVKGQSGSSAMPNVITPDG